MGELDRPVRVNYINDYNVGELDRPVRVNNINDYNVGELDRPVRVHYINDYTRSINQIIQGLNHVVKLRGNVEMLIKCASLIV